MNSNNFKYQTLQEIRKRHQESIEFLSQSIGFSAKAIESFENGSTLPPNNYLQNFSQHYRIPLSHLLLQEPIQTCIYPGSFDPVTNGHLDIIKRASKLFDELIVGIAYAHHKKTLFNLEERIQMVKEATQAQNTKVIVVGFTGLLVDFCKQQNCYTIVRGVRVVSDFDYEFQLAWANQMLDKKIDTVFLAPASQNTHISGRLVREIGKLGGDLSPFLPQSAVSAFQHKITTNE